MDLKRVLLTQKQLFALVIRRLFALSPASPNEVLENWQSIIRKWDDDKLIKISRNEVFLLGDSLDSLSHEI